MQLFDQTLSGSESRARIKLRDELDERARLSEDRLALLDEILPVLADAGIPDEAVVTLLRGKIGMSRLRAAHTGATLRLPRDPGHLRLLEGSYYIRQFAPKVLATVRFAGGTEAKPLLEALEILRELNATGARNVPDKAPTLFVPARWQGYLDEAAAKGDATAYRHYHGPQVGTGGVEAVYPAGPEPMTMTSRMPPLTWRAPGRSRRSGPR